MLLSAFTLFHVVLSLIGLGTGFVVLYGFIAAKRLDGWTPWFLWTTLLTSLTGFLFPEHQFLPSHAVGILSVIVLGLAFLALYRFKLYGTWSRVFVICSVVALYFNAFVAVAQSFKHIAPLTALAPTQTEPPFGITQLVVLLAFVTLGVMATRKSRAVATAY